MRIAFGVILVTGICGGYVLSLPLAHHVISKDLDSTVDRMYKSYVSISNDGRDDSNRLDVISGLQRVYIDGPKFELDRKKQTQETAYLLVKSMRQRNKRYISYLTLCHFKICNMGRKRTTRYFHMIRSLDDNES